MLPMWWVSSHLRNFKFRELKYLIMDHKQAAFVLNGDVIFIILDSKQIEPLLQRSTLSLSSLTIHTNILEKTVWSKIVSASAHKKCRNKRDPWRIIFQ